MKVLARARLGAAAARRGVALLLSFLVLLVVIALVYQIHIVTSTDGKVAHNDITATRMDLAIESALFEVYQLLADDAGSSDSGSGDVTPGGADPGGLGGDPGGAAGGGAGAGEGGAVDSQMDEWARPQATSINEVELRIVIQDENSKYNILNMLNPDEEVAELALDRVAQILDDCRDQTQDDIDSGTAEEMARVMLEHMRQRSDSLLARPVLLTDSGTADGDLGMPLTLREFSVLEPFEEYHFRDYFDADGVRVHSIESFLTIWTSVQTGSPVIPTGEEGEEATENPVPGYAVNINTAPAAVLANLHPDVDQDFWDDVLIYRNTEAELEEDEEELEPMLDENGEEIIQRQFFENFEVFDELRGWINLEPAVQEEVEDLLTLESNVFSIFVTARQATQAEENQLEVFSSREEREAYERSGLNLTRTVRSIVWRNEEGGELGVVPLVRWEVLDYQPLEVLDYPDDSSFR